METDERYYVNVTNANPITLTKEEIGNMEIELKVKVKGKILGFVYPKINVTKKPSKFEIYPIHSKRKKTKLL